jgi:hypothetical protein
MLMDLMGMGKRPSEITIDSAMFRAVSVQYQQAIAATAAVLGLEYDEIRRSVQIATAPTDIELLAGTIPAGSVAGQILSWTAYRDHVAVLVAEELWTVTDIPEWDLALDGEFLVRIVVDGAPPLRLELRIGNDRIPGLPGVAGGQLAVAATAVRSIPDVRSAPPGVVIAPVFGAYRWPDAR